MLILRNNCIYYFSLNKLILNDNRLTSLPDKLFLENGCALKALFIKGNKLNFMNQKALEPCDALRYLFLSDNLITKLPPKLLSGKPVLKTVDLSRNQIQERD
jgi:Leucine-rich repeat (LRR) protein